LCIIADILETVQRITISTRYIYVPPIAGHQLVSNISQSAKDGYRSYLQAYASHSLRSVFDVHKLDLVKVAKSFGFATPPRIDISLGASLSRDKKVEGRRAYGSQPSQGRRPIKPKRF
jgi:ATP-dependent RNA helicase DDX18/HAS1